MFLLTLLHKRELELISEITSPMQLKEFKVIQLKQVSVLLNVKILLIVVPTSLLKIRKQT